MVRRFLRATTSSALMTMIERCPAPLSNVVRLRVRRADGVEQLLDLFATDKRLRCMRPRGSSYASC
jgi:hypothetical protein